MSIHALKKFVSQVKRVRWRHQALWSENTVSLPETYPNVLRCVKVIPWCERRLWHETPAVSRLDPPLLFSCEDTAFTSAWRSGSQESGELHLHLPTRLGTDTTAPTSPLLHIHISATLFLQYIYYGPRRSICGSESCFIHNNFTAPPWSWGSSITFLFRFFSCGYHLTILGNVNTWITLPHFTLYNLWSCYYLLLETIYFVSILVTISTVTNSQFESAHSISVANSVSVEVCGSYLCIDKILIECCGGYISFCHHMYVEFFNKENDIFLILPAVSPWRISLDSVFPLFYAVFLIQRNTPHHYLDYLRW